MEHPREAMKISSTGAWRRFDVFVIFTNSTEKRGVQANKVKDNASIIEKVLLEEA
jgi:hypothetical protein